MRISLFKNLLPHNNSQVTLELRHFIESGSTLFDPEDKYPIWDEKHRAELEKKIIEHYYNREIGFETFGRFKFELNVRMREIMPYYNKIYATTQYKYNPIENYNMTEEFNDKGKNNGKHTGKSVNKESDTPQSSIDNLDNYLSSASKVDTESNSNENSENNHTGWRKGNIGVTSTQQLIEYERKITLNLDLEIIKELEDLFLGVY